VDNLPVLATLFVLCELIVFYVYRIIVRAWPLADPDMMAGAIGIVVLASLLASFIVFVLAWPRIKKRLFGKKKN